MCKNEVYRIKTIAYYAMLNRAKRVERGEYNKKLLREFPPLLRLVDEITESEYVDPKAIKNWGDTFTTELFTDTLKHSRTCNYCNCDIFSRYAVFFQRQDRDIFCFYNIADIYFDSVNENNYEIINNTNNTTYGHNLILFNSFFEFSNAISISPNTRYNSS